MIGTQRPDRWWDRTLPIRSPLHTRPIPMRASHPRPEAAVCPEAEWCGDNADIRRRQSDTAQPGDHDMGEVLTNPPPFIENVLQRRQDFRRLRIVNKIAVDPPHQIGCGSEDTRTLRKALRRILRDRRPDGDKRTCEQIAHGRRGHEAIRRERRLAHLLPARRTHLAGRCCTRNIDTRSRIDAQDTVSGFDNDVLGMNAEKSVLSERSSRTRLDLDIVRDQLWPSPFLGSSLSEQRAKLTGLS